MKFEIDENQLLAEKHMVRNQAQTETHSDPENILTDLQHFHKTYIWLEYLLGKSLQRFWQSQT